MATVATQRGSKKTAAVLRPRVLIPFAVAVVVLVAAGVYGIVRPQNHVRPTGPGKQGALHWSNAIFANRAELRAWLVAHGRSYQAWAKAHPAALRLLPEGPAK